ncbi:hypothetical protein D9V84_04145 [Bacteroidetes/Chlorobi group bacterium Naka2016]|nr:MAG: hypothetical protein D9V84_04145 [Bacteroidetes/Chlorobi group bacterium Naka2016]
MQIEMIWVGNITARFPLTQWGSVYFENHTCCFVTHSYAITYTGGRTELCFVAIDATPALAKQCSNCRGPPNAEFAFRRFPIVCSKPIRSLKIPCKYR